METKKKTKKEVISAAVVEVRLASLPRLFPSIPAMVAESSRLTEMAETHESRFEKHGWMAADTADQRSKLEKFFAAHGKLTSRKEASEEATAKFRSTWKEADEFRIHLQGGLQVLALTNPTVIRSVVELRRSKVTTAQELLTQLSSVTEVVGRNAAALQLHLGVDAVVPLAMHLKALTKSLGRQSDRLAIRARLSEEQKKAVDALAASVIRLRSIGRIAFAKDKVLLKELNRRIGKKKAVSKGTATQASETPATAAPPGPAAATAGAVTPEKTAAAAPVGQASATAQ